MAKKEKLFVRSFGEKNYQYNTFDTSSAGKTDENCVQLCKLLYNNDEYDSPSIVKLKIDPVEV
jgi:hypothetical protein